MINIYHGDKLLLFCSTNEMDKVRKSAEIHSYEVLKPDENLSEYLEEIEPDPATGAYIVESNDALDLLEAFSKGFKVESAAGGLVRNKKGQYLMIFRRGFWDLPKGKIEKGEKKQEAALREVEEETGITNLKLGKALSLGVQQGNISYHTFTKKSGPVLKRSIWYHMSISDNQKPVPQTEEDIEIAKWVSKKKLTELLPLSYGSIQDVLNVVLQED